MKLTQPHRRALKALAAAAVFVLAAIPTGLAFAQANKELCVEEYFAALADHEPDPLSIAAGDVVEILGTISSGLGQGKDVIAIECTYTTKALAFPADGSLEGVPAGKYIVYHPTWVREMVGTDRFQAIALFGHELGHHLLDHFEKDDMPVLVKEIQADYFAGCAVALFGGTLDALEDLFDRLRGAVDTTHPSRLRSLAAARRGFDGCDGQVITPGAASGLTADQGEQPPVEIPSATLRDAFLRWVWTDWGKDDIVRYEIEVVVTKRGPALERCTLELRTQGTTRQGETKTRTSNIDWAFVEFGEGLQERAITYLFDNLLAGRYEENAQVRLVCSPYIATPWTEVEFPAQYQIAACRAGTSDLPRSVVQSCQR